MLPALRAFPFLIHRTLPKPTLLLLRRNFIHLPPPSQVRCYASSRHQQIVRELLSRIDYFITVNQVEENSEEDKVDAAQEKVVKYVSAQLDRAFQRLPRPHETFDHVISLLMDRQCILAAFAVYEKMLSMGILPSLELDAKMLALLVKILPNDPAIALAFDKIFTNPEFTEERLTDVLEVMLALGSPPSTIIHTVNRFLEAKGDGYTPGRRILAQAVESQVQSGNLQEAFDLLNNNDSDELDITSPVPPQAPYVALMSAISKAKPGDNSAIETVLLLMQEKGVQPDKALMNVLISREIRARSLYRTFVCYELMKTLGSQLEHVRPDGQTFASLFSALNNLYESASYKRQKHTETAPILTPRRLFYEMIAAHDAQKNDAQTSFLIQTSLLNTALRAIVFKRDYAAAYIVIRSFKIYEQGIDVKTYYAVMKHIMSRIYWEIKRRRKLVGESRWADRFLGIEAHARIHEFVVDEELGERVLAYGRQQPFDLMQIIARKEEGGGNVEEEKKTKKKAASFSKLSQKTRNKPGPRSYSTPTVKMMDGDVPVAPWIRFSPEPLERILRRAILAQLAHPARVQSEDEDEGGSDDRSWSSRISKVISEAKAEMLPSRQNGKGS
ncbi:hypothetical protein AMATHDRAFT_66738 [Amanita thiersii Skay4041]|uniref:Pentacotripeptide-repeat region of PRORP domain-containing protein n=1 Tax=Amanita thiersii Skay4041 TaxID=703135 RepID=A0A2A9N9Y9_9AGAR|nr:hypothetical protein AMATHDRAFT_66738 [Amanita thiersii Skay4041]